MNGYPNDTIEVKVANMPLRLPAGEDGEELRRLAVLVDKRFQEISRNSPGPFNTQRFALLTALSFAREAEDLRVGATEAVEDTHAVLDHVLEALTELKDFAGERGAGVPSA